jgi:hypothetical protein
VKTKDLIPPVCNAKVNVEQKRANKYFVILLQIMERKESPFREEALWVVYGEIKGLW